MAATQPPAPAGHAEQSPQSVGVTTPKLVAQANRNGHFFLLDRTNGKHILTTPHIDSLNWTKGIDQKTGLAVDYDPTKDVQDYMGTTSTRARPGCAEEGFIEGVQEMKEIDPTHYTAVLETKVAYLKFKFNVTVEVVRMEAPSEIEAKVALRLMGLTVKTPDQARTLLDSLGR